MKRPITVVLALIALAAAAGAYYYFSAPPATTPSAPTPEESQAVRGVVQEFGQKLRFVSLAAEPDFVAEAVQQYYAPYLSTALLTQWKNDPLQAPGKMTSSPWPDRIEIVSAVKESEEFYRVKGEVVEVSSADGGAEVARYPIEIEVGWDRDASKWVITALQKSTG